MKDPDIRKQENIAKLKELGIPFISHLPVIESADQVRIRTAEEIACRAICCLLTIQMACEINQNGYDQEPVEFFTDLLEQFGVKDQLTPHEKAIFRGTASEQEVVNMVWKYEAYWALLWALGIVKKLEFPCNICDCDFAIKAVSSHKSFEEFMEQVSLRNIEEILDEADLIYRYDWACVNARIKGQEAPAGLDKDVVPERHWGLNWLIDADGDNNWDNVDIST